MLFNSLEFFLFLPIVFLLYWFVFKKKLFLQNLFIVFVSYIFYGWWSYKFLFLIFFTSICSFISGLLINKYIDKDKKKAKIISAINIIINLSILGFFKYFNFFIESFISAFSLVGISLDIHTLNIILPVGISFYTFQALSYSIDVYKKKLKATKDMVSFLAYVSFFPQLVAGPIERATNLLPQFHKPRVFSYDIAVDGCRQMLWGFFKKVVIADSCAEYVDYVFNNYNSLSSSSLVLGAIFFTFQIYGDFSGYSDIAIGAAKLFGIKLMKNFSLPYLSRDIAEFWRHWHISLTTWFRDYLYIPLGGSRKGKKATIRNTFIIFLVSGFWHGASWTFVFWGLYHSLLFLPLLLMNRNRKYLDIVAKNTKMPSLKEFFQIVSTFVLVAIGWIIFRAKTIKEAFYYFISMFSFSIKDKPFNDISFIKIIFFILILIVFEWIQRKKEHCFDFSNIKHWYIRYAIYFTALITILIYMTGGQKEFIYFQF